MRKVLSFVLVLSLVLGSFSMAFAATPAAGLSDIDGIANEDAIQVAYDLGIVTGNPDGTFLPTKAVNRAEFAAMITRALAIPDSALAGYATTSFKDTAGYGWAISYLGFCQSKGIMLGDGAGNAMPGRTITVNEAVTMALRAVGYTANSSVLVGAWPANYVTLAQNLDLYDDVVASGNVDKAAAAQIIYNLLTVEKVSVNTDGDTNGLGTTLLEAGLGCTVQPAMVLDNDNTADAKINMTPYIGAYAVVYTDSDDEIVAVGEVKSTFLTGDYDSVAHELEVGDITYTNVTPSAAVIHDDAINIVNAEEDGTASPGATATLATDRSITIAVDLSGKKVTKIYSVATWDVQANDSEAFLFDDGDLDMEDFEINGIPFPQDNNDELDYNAFILEGVASLDKIAVDNVVYAYTNTDGDITKLSVGTETVTGKVTKVNADGDEFTIGGKKYGVSDVIQTIPAIGETGTAYLDFAGDIYDWDVEDTAEGNYAIVLGSEDESTISDGRIKLLAKDGSEKIYDVDSDATTTSALETNFVKGDLVEFGLDKDGVVDELTELTTAAIGGDGKLSATGKVLGGASVDSSVVVFTFDGNDFDISTVAKVEKDTDLRGGNTIGVYTPAGGKIEVIIVDADNVDTDEVYAVINSVEDAINDNDEEVQFITGFAGGKAFEAYTDDDNTIATAPAFTTGTIYVLSVDADGVVTDSTCLQAQFGLEDYVSGTITGKDGNYDIELGAAGYKTIDPNAMVYELDLDDEEYAIKSISSLKEDDMVFMWQADEDSEKYDVIVFVRP